MTESSTTVHATADATEMCSYAVDLWTDAAELLTDAPALVQILRDAAAAGHATVLAEAVHVFPNGAVTASLVLSQSHINVHTWPELCLANVDLLTCGQLNGDLMLDHVRTAMHAHRTNVTRVTRTATPEPRG